MSSLYPLRLSKVASITSRAVVLRFEIPEPLKATFQYTAGQYLTLEAEIDGALVRRSYSICSAPHEDRLEVGIKQIPNGVFSTFAKQELAEGNILTVGAPEGRFTYTPASAKEKITAFAAGSGITPILSIAKTALRAEQQFTLVYGNTSPEEAMFMDVIEALQQEFPQRFKVIHTFSRANASNAFSGRIDNDFIQAQWEAQALKADKYYLCGPEGMIDTVATALKSRGTADEAIFFELFTASAASDNSAATIETATSAKVIVVCDGLEHELKEMAQGKTILDAALAQKIDVPYSCQGGVCSSCIARVKEGKATMVTNQILTDSEVEEGLILTCQAHPATGRVIVDFDDV